MTTQYTALDICNARLNAQKIVIASYKQNLATKSGDELLALCQQQGIAVRATAFATRCALLLAKKHALHHFELQVRKNRLEEMRLTSHRGTS